MTITTEKSLHHLTCPVASVTWLGSSADSSVQVQGGNPLPPKRRTIVVFDSMPDEARSMTKGAYLAAQEHAIIAKTCECGCNRLASALYDGLSPYCAQLAEHRARRIG